MVNSKSNKEIIYNLLKQADAPLSGEFLAGRTGISRVAVWKNISRLKDEGYLIESGHDGYLLTGLTEKPLPRELSGRSDKIHYFDELDSTMSRAAEAAAGGCADGTTLIAGRQTAGVSRGGGRWTSPDGGLYFSRLRTRPLNIEDARLYCCAMTAAVSEAVKEISGIETEVRWPNEVYSDDRKIAGVLTRFSGEIGMLDYVTTGIGINLDIPESALPKGAASISELSDSVPAAKVLLSKLLDLLEAADSEFRTNKQTDSQKIIRKCQNQMRIPGELLVCSLSGREYRGHIDGIDSLGRLLIRTEGDLILTINKGEDYHYV